MTHHDKIETRKVQKYGYIPDLPDRRDHYFTSAIEEKALPPKVDLTAQCPPVYDQGNLGSCTANAIAGAVQFDLKKQAEADYFIPSRLFIYYNERVIEHSVSEDAGAMIRDGIKTVNKQGAPHETLWPYKIAKFATKPSAKSYTDALLHQSLKYQRVNQSLSQMKSVLAGGYPFVVGFTVYESFESEEVDKTGTVPMPGPDEQVLGGHAVLVVGYDDTTQRFILRNSWGPRWGKKGYFTMPYQYLQDGDLSEDFWVIKVME